MYFMGIGDGASQLLCIFVWRVFRVRYYTHIFSCSGHISSQPSHITARSDIRMPVYVLSAHGYGYQQEKRRDEKKKEGERKPVRVAIPHTDPSTNHSFPRPLTLLQNSLSSSLLLPPNNSALPKLLVRTITALRTIVLLKSDPHVIFLRKLRLMILLSDLASRLLAMGGMRRRASRRLATGNLPLHQLRKSAFFVGRELRVRSDLSYYAVGADADDDVAALDRAEAVGDGDGGVVAFEELGEGVVY
jgi:hypothetical protein